jgi:flagellar biosynthetic protein FlhB
MFYALRIMSTNLSSTIMNGMSQLFNSMPDAINGVSDMKGRFIIVFSVAAGVLLPLMAVSIFVSIIATMAQTRLLVTPSQVKPDFSRLNPLKGIKRMFSLKSLVELFKSLLKVAVIGVIIYIDVSPQFEKIMLLFDTNLRASMAWTANLLIDVGIKSSIAMVIIGIADYFYQWWTFEKQIMMSKEEIKEEFKQIEGNPEIKGRIRNMQRRLSQMRMMQAVPKADVVIRNPTHYAIALMYEGRKGKAPLVVAMGQDNMALKIVEIAIKNNVHITENRPLAQALYKVVKVGDEIPTEFYKAVAEVLAYIYRLKRAGRS